MIENSLPTAYPHGDLIQLFDDVFFVTGSVRMSTPVPMSFSRNMTVVREGHDLTLINSVRLDESGLDALGKLGKVRHVIRIAGFHGMDDPFYKQRYDADVLAIEGQTYAAGIEPEPTTDDIYFEADIEMNQDTQLPIEDATLYQFKTAMPPEGLSVLEREGGIVVSGDCLQNWHNTDRYFSFLARPMMRMMGFIKPYNIGPAWLRTTKPDISEIRAILDLRFNHVLPAHGEQVIGNAKQQFQTVIEKLAEPR